MNIPKDLKYTNDHEWIRVEEDNIAYIGITHFAQGELGDIVYIDIDSEGETLEKEEIFGSIEAVKTVSDLYMPLGGTIEEVNPELEDQADLVNKDPYGKGWLVKIKVDNLADLDTLLSAADYENSIGA